jgi:carboxyl-terminal processing protease
VWLNGVERMRVPSSYRLRRDAPLVAVVTDRLTASSGRGRHNRVPAAPPHEIVGTPTCGASTANTGFPLSDGSTLVLTVALMADRTRRAYGDTVLPDEVVTDPNEAVRHAAASLIGATSLATSAVSP